MITVKGGYKHQRKIVTDVIDWFKYRMKLSYLLSVTVRIKPMNDCYGTCEKVNEYNYYIELHGNQTIRNFVMTLVHELIHVKQYETNQWTGDGEDEAWGLQADLTDDLWKENII